MREYDRPEAAYRCRKYYHEAHYSLDRGDVIKVRCDASDQSGCSERRTLQLEL